MDNNITLQFNLTLSRENIETLRKIILPYTSRHPEDMPAEICPCHAKPEATPQEAAAAIVEETPAAGDLIKDLEAEPVALWPDDKYLEAVAPCIRENKEKAATFLALFVQGNKVPFSGDRPKMRDVPQGLRGHFVTGLYQYLGKQYNGVA